MRLHTTCLQCRYSHCPLDIIEGSSDQYVGDHMAVPAWNYHYDRVYDFIDNVNNCIIGDYRNYMTNIPCACDFATKYDCIHRTSQQTALRIHLMMHELH